MNPLFLILIMYSVALNLLVSNSKWDILREALVTTKNEIIPWEAVRDERHV